MAPTRRDILIGGGAALVAANPLLRAISSPIKSMCGANRGYIGGDNLPYAREVEYLQSTGTQWIQTDWIPNTSQDYETFVSAEYVGGNEVGCLFGTTSASGPGGTNNARFYQINKTTTEGQYRLISSSGDKFFSVSSGRHSWNLIKGGKLYVDEELKATGGGIVFYNPLVLFARYDNAQKKVNQKGKWRIWEVKLSSPSGIDRHYIPVIDHSGVACMYDKVSNELFYNNGTGKFLTNEDI